MMPHEKLEDYIGLYDMDSLCFTLKKNDSDRIAYFVRGLRLIQQQPTTWKETVQAAKLAAYSMSTSDSGVQSATSFYTSQMPSPYSLATPSTATPLYAPPSSFNASQVPSPYAQSLQPTHATTVAAICFNLRAATVFALHIVGLYTFVIALRTNRIIDFVRSIK